MRSSRKLSLLLVSLTFICSISFMIFGAGPKPVTSRPRSASFRATCFCVISKNELAGRLQATGVIKSLTDEVGTSYTGVYQQSEENQVNCKQTCRDKAADYVRSQTFAATACAAGVTDGTVLTAYSAAGNRDYRLAQSIGSLLHVPQQTKSTCTCPAGWACNGCSPQVAGGITTDGRCKKWAGVNTISPYPPDGTPIGSWGFTWGNSVNAWGTSANGGAPTCVTTVIQSGSCGWY